VSEAITPSHARDRDHRVGVIGYGLAGAVFHAPLIAATPGLQIAAVVTRDAERRRAVTRDHPGARLVDDVERLWEMRDELDLVVVASPNGTHVPFARAALAAGLHVVVDKPMAVTSEEGRALVDEARRRGRLLVPFQNRRWDGDFLTVRRLIDEGGVGRVLRFESRFDRWRPAPKARWREADAPRNGEGIAYDIGSHLVDQALRAFGPARHVYAELDRRHPDATVDDDSFIAITHATGVRSHLSMSTLAAQPGARFRVMGDRAAYEKHGLDPQEGALRGGARPGDPGWGEEPESRWGTLGVGDDRRPIRTERGAYERFYAGIAAALGTGAPPPVDPMDAVAGLEVIEAAFRSSAEGRVVTMGE
jgi:predicted dehydrogenase